MELTGFADRLDARLARARAAAEALMRDTCRVTKPGVGKGPFNEATGKYDAPDPVLVYEGKCRIPKAAANASDATSGEAVWKVGEYPFAVPVTDTAAAAIDVGMTVEYLTAADDPALAGRRFGIVKPLRQSAAKDRRFKMQEVVGS